jgi:hypothetical protein
VRPLAHPPEPGYPCFISDLGELAWLAPREGLPQYYDRSALALRWDSIASEPTLEWWRFCDQLALTQNRWRIRLVAYGARLESVLGESPRGFESPILRQ